MTDDAKPHAAPPTEPPAGTPIVPPEALAPEIGGRKGPEPTRFGDWEKDGRCSDF